MRVEPLRSTYADDMDMRELLEEFVASLAETSSRIHAGLEAEDGATVKQLGHQLKGAGGGYGYPEITDAGEQLESAVERTGAVTDSVRSAAARLLELLERAQAGLD